MKHIDRRTALHILGVAGLGSIGASKSVVSQQQTTQSAEKLQTYGYDNRNSNFAPNHTGPTRNVKLDWEFQSESYFTAMPIKSNGLIYAGSGDYNLYAINADSGELGWSYGIFEGLSNPVEVDEDTVYFGGSGLLHALNAMDGSERWVKDLDVVNFESSPKVVDDTIYIGVYEGLLALDVADGSKRWFHSTQDVVSPPAVVDNVVYMSDSRNSIYALDANTGNEQWEYNTNGSSPGAPTVVDGTLYIGDISDTVYALDANTGEEQWKRPLTGSVPKSVAVADGTMYVGASHAGLYALNADDGTRKWVYRDVGSITGTPAVVDGTVYFGSGNKYTALDIEDGTERWVYETGGTVCSPAVVNNTVYGGTEQSNSIIALTVPEDPLEEYRNDNGKIDDTGLLEAISDWRNGNLEDTQLLELISEWRDAGGNVEALSIESLPRVN